MDYIKDTWIERDIWPPYAWSIYLQQVPSYTLKINVIYKIGKIIFKLLQVRTTNDVEGWHNQLYNHAGQKFTATTP